MFISRVDHLIIKCSRAIGRHNSWMTSAGARTVRLLSLEKESLEQFSSQSASASHHIRREEFRSQSQRQRACVALDLCALRASSIAYELALIRERHNGNSLRSILVFSFSQGPIFDYSLKWLTYETKTYVTLKYNERSSCC